MEWQAYRNYGDSPRDRSGGTIVALEWPISWVIPADADLVTANLVVLPGPSIPAFARWV